MAEKVKAALKASKKLDDPTRCDILELLGQLEGELQAKDIAIATLKSECLKHLLHNLRSDKGLLCDPALALNRDGTRASPSSKASSSKTLVNCEKGAQHLSVCGGSTSTNDTYKLVALYNLVESQKTTLARLSNCLDTAEKQRISLLKDLDEERSKNTQLLKAQSQKASEATPSNSKHDDDEDDDDPEVNIDVFFFF